MNLVLIGYRATGKSSVGRGCAVRLGYDFVDTDELVEQVAGEKISSIVAQEGWEVFRELEKKAVAQASRGERTVIATGGGVVINKYNINMLSANGFLVWLTASPEFIASRLGADQAQIISRPALSGADAVSEIDQVLAQREPLYRGAAHAIVSTQGRGIGEVTDQVVDLFQRKLREKAENGRK